MGFMDWVRKHYSLHSCFWIMLAGALLSFAGNLMLQYSFGDEITSFGMLNLKWPFSSPDEASSSLSWTEVFKGKRLYVLGDSTVASGDFIMTARPYGLDLMDGAASSGRFSNGYTMADYLAMRIGSPIPAAYVSLTEELRVKNSGGINFASGGCGILNDTRLLPGCRTLDDQIYHLTNERLSSAHLEDSLFFLSFGSNDFIKIKKPAFDLNVTVLVSYYMDKIQSLYKNGARLFLINNVGPLGCIPNKRDQQAKGAPCDQDLNRKAREYSMLLGKALREQKRHMDNVTMVLADSEKILTEFLSTPLKYDFTDVDHPCCGAWDVDLGMFLCNSTSVVCHPRNGSLFFDGAHITQSANEIFIEKCFSGFICREISN